MKARIQTTRMLIRDVAAKWDRQYSGGRNYAPDKRAIYERLRLLDGETATPEDVREIIGNDSWTSLQCGGCSKYVGALVIVGDEPDYESSTAYLCYACVKDAFAAFDCREHADCAAHPETLGRACREATENKGDGKGER